MWPKGEECRNRVIYLTTHLIQDIERQSVSVECGVDNIEIGVNRTQLLGSYHKLSLAMGDFESDGKSCLTWETESSHYFRSELGQCGYARQVREAVISL